MSKKHDTEAQAQAQAQEQQAQPSAPAGENPFLNPSTGGNTTEERAQYAKHPPSVAETDLGPKTRAQEHFGNTAVSEQSVDPDRPLYGEEPGEGGMGRAVSPMQGQEFYNQDDPGADRHGQTQDEQLAHPYPEPVGGVAPTEGEQNQN